MAENPQKISNRLVALPFAIVTALWAPGTHALHLAFTEPTPTGLSSLETDAFAEDGVAWPSFHEAALDSRVFEVLRVAQTETIQAHVIGFNPSRRGAEPEVYVLLLAGLACMVFMARRRRQVN